MFKFSENKFIFFYYIIIRFIDNVFDLTTNNKKEKPQSVTEVSTPFREIRLFTHFLFDRNANIILF